MTDPWTENERMANDDWWSPKWTWPPREGKKADSESPGACVSREELERLHAATSEVCRDEGLGPGTEEYSLLCSLGALLGRYPKVKAKTVSRALDNFRRLIQER